MSSAIAVTSDTFVLPSSRFETFRLWFDTILPSVSIINVERLMRPNVLKELLDIFYFACSDMMDINAAVDILMDWIRISISSSSILIQCRESNREELFCKLDSVVHNPFQHNSYQFQEYYIKVNSTRLSMVTSSYSTTLSTAGDNQTRYSSTGCLF